MSANSKKSSRKKSGRSRGGKIGIAILNVFLTLMLIGLITGTVVACAFAIYVNNYVDTSVDGFDTLLAEGTNLTTQICYVDTNGEIKEIESERLYAGENRVWADYEEFPEDLVKAFVAIEDKRFFDHNGVDWLNTAKATFKYFTSPKTRGGSTITQQLIKNVTKNDDVSIQRKVQEILKALNLEKRYDKTEILEMYLNSIYFSHGCYGVASAAHVYFGKDVKDLDLNECAMLAGIVQNPSKYDPINHPDEATDRRHEVLTALRDQHKITNDEYYAVYYEDLVLNTKEEEEIETKYRSWYTDAAQTEAIELLMNKYDYTREIASMLVLTKGYKIVTAQNYTLQKQVEEYFANDDNFARVDSSIIQPEMSCILIDPSTGNVVALAGGRGEKKGNRIFNYATQAVRPAGSSIKPLSVYAPALESKTINYASVFDDVPINFGTEKVNEDGSISYSRPTGYPSNAPKVYNGLTTVHDAIRRSVNTVAWRALEGLGLQNSYDFVKNKLHLDTIVESKQSNGNTFTDIAYAPLALGQLTDGVTLLDMTAAYSIFANNGVYNNARIVLKILDSENNVIVDNAQKSEIVISEQNAYIMTKMMQEVVTSGTASAATIKNSVNVAGKTGTTQNDCDRWMIGYSPYYICGVWFGYSMPRQLSKFKTSPSPHVLVWDDLMQMAHRSVFEDASKNNTSIKKFEQPSGIKTATYCRDSGMLLSDACAADPRGSRAETGYFTSDNMPTEKCTTHVLVNYDTVTKAIATDTCPSENIKQVGLIKVSRGLARNITVTDAQYVFFDIGDLTPGGQAGQPYFINLLSSGKYIGTSGSSGSTQYNHVCREHLTDISKIVLPQS